MAAKKKTSSKAKSSVKKVAKKNTFMKKTTPKKGPSKKAKSKPAVSQKKATSKTAGKKNVTAKTSGKKPSKTVAPSKTSRSATFLKKTASPRAKPTTPAFSSVAALSVLPTGDHVFVEVLSEERRTPGGLIIPDTVGEMEGYLEGKVLAVGSGKLNKKGHRRPLSVERGEKVMFPRWAGQSVEQGGRRYVILREDELLGVKAD